MTNITNSALPAAEIASALPQITPSAPPQKPADNAGRPDKAEMKEALQAFEAIFARQLISTMRAGSLGDELFGSGAGEQFRDMNDSLLADDLAAKGSLGLADMMLKQFGYDE
ncbi:rod-binding protein [Parasphingorhabdus sp.]|uniref:rod-binding protein n=1 Tax=Parasphingorhabdus sp. TaxID=2709688 RepID=UPI003267855D